MPALRSFLAVRSPRTGVRASIAGAAVVVLMLAVSGCAGRIDPPLAPPPPATPEEMQEGVRDALRRYEEALEQRDVTLLRPIDRSMTSSEEQALSRELRAAERYDVEMELVDDIGFGPGMVTRRAGRGRYVMTTVPEMATVVCRVTITILPRGRQTPIVAPPRRMTFYMARDGATWFINSKY